MIIYVWFPVTHFGARDRTSQLEYSYLLIFQANKKEGISIQQVILMLCLLGGVLKYKCEKLFVRFKQKQKYFFSI